MRSLAATRSVALCQIIAMNKLLSTAILGLSVLSFQLRAQDPLPQVVSGRIDRIEHFKSRYVTPRHIDVWLPEGYDSLVGYPVLYMHDGQMLFDPESSWNRQSWNIDNVATELFKENTIKKFIVVGIWNGGSTRHTDYFPQRPFEQLSQTAKDTVIAQLQKAGRTTEVFSPKSDAYLKFIVRELMPFIQKRYSVNSDRENTFLAGSSMGGLISIYGLCEYPKIFGGAACLSTHWPGTFTLENNPMPDAFLSYLSKKLPDPRKHKIYFDCGDQTLDALYPDVQKKVDRLMLEKGYRPDSWQTGYFPGKDHSEQAWSGRLHIPLTFLFK